jgi:hypothetical protein
MVETRMFQSWTPSPYVFLEVWNTNELNLVDELCNRTWEPSLLCPVHFVLAGSFGRKYDWSNKWLYWLGMLNRFDQLKVTPLDRRSVRSEKTDRLRTPYAERTKEYIWRNVNERVVNWERVNSSSSTAGDSSEAIDHSSTTAKYSAGVSSSVYFFFFPLTFAPPVLPHFSEI